MNFIFIALNLCLVAWSTPTLRSQNALTTEVKNNTFHASLKKGYHFNEKAPNSLQIEDKHIPASIFSGQKISIANLPSNFHQGTAYLYVCDDKVTFCEVHSVKLGNKAATKKVKNATPMLSGTNSNGFLKDFASALKLAGHMKKIMLVDFSARWCPACQRLEAEIFSTSKFQSLTQDFIKVKLDGDLFSNAPLKAKYNIQGYPTLLFLTSDGKEITRFLDYQPMNTIQSIVLDVLQNPESIESLENKASNKKRDQTLWPRYYQAGQYDKALSLLQKHDLKPKEYLFSKVQVALENFQLKPDTKSLYLKELEEAIRQEPETTRSLQWRLQLAQHNLNNKDRLKVISNESQKLTEKLLKDKSLLLQSTETDFVGEYTGYEGLYVAIMNADIAEITGLDTKKSWQLVLNQGQSYNISAKQRGPALRIISAAVKAEKHEVALKLVHELLRLNPDDGDLLRREMRILSDLKKFAQAVEAGEKALKQSYGANEFFVVAPLAKAYLAIGNKDKAKNLVKLYLQRNEINFDEMKTIKKSLEALIAKELDHF